MRLADKVAIVTGGASGIGFAYARKPQPFDAIAEDEWDRVMAVNVKGIWNCVRAVVPLMREQGGDRIVNVASAIVAKGTAMLLHDRRRRLRLLDAVTMAAVVDRAPACRRPARQ